METLIILAISGLFNILCFVIGAKVGQSAAKGETISMPNFNPLEAIRKNQAKREADRAEDKKNTILRNIERYDGTGRGQEDVG